jgi:hypothetical protein
MHSSIIKFIAIALGAAFLAVLGLFRRAFRTGEDPSDDGPRALVAEFIGLWIGTFCLIWSFTVDGKNLQWTLRGIAIAAGLAGLVLSLYFAGNPEVGESPTKNWMCRSPSGD